MKEKQNVYFNFNNSGNNKFIYNITIALLFDYRKGEWEKMGGRSDYEERRKARIERYKQLAEKSKEKSRL